MRRTLQAGAIIYGLLAAVLGLLAVPLLVLGTAFGGRSAPMVVAATILVSILALGAGLGLSLSWAGWRGLEDRPSPWLRLPSPWVLVILFVVLLGLGELARVTPLRTVLLPAFHVAVSLLPPLILVAIVAAPMRRAGVLLTRRDLVGQFGYGALFATSVAIVLESAAALAAMAAGIGVVSVVPAGQQKLQSLVNSLQAPLIMQDPEALLDAFLSPALLAAVALLVAVVTPMIEEVVKSLGSLMTGAQRGRRRFSRAQAFAYGVMAGAGFSLTEALFYAANGLPHAWAGPVLLRSGTVVIHGLSTGLLALGWFEVLAGRPRRFAGYAVAGIGLHGLWNALGGLAALTGLNVLGDSAASRAANTGLAALSVVLLGATFVLAFGVIVYLSQSLAQEARPKPALPPGPIPTGTA